MIEKLGAEEAVARFTTLCTPHKGSPIARGFLKPPKWMLHFLAFWMDFWYRLFGDKHPDSYKVCQELASSNPVEEETFKLNKA